MPWWGRPKEQRAAKIAELRRLPSPTATWSVKRRTPRSKNPTEAILEGIIDSTPVPLYKGGG
jgi:hypothetical protein